MTTLFDPIKVGRLACPNRIWMAPLTRGRGTREHVPTDLMATYYSQRASAGLIITEATHISLEGSGWPYAGGLWSAEHVANWKKVTDCRTRGRRTYLRPALAHGTTRAPLPARSSARVRQRHHGAGQGAHL